MHKQQPWQKKGGTTFDVTMGSYEAAEICELLGSSLLSQLLKLNINIEEKREICRIYNHNGLRITIEANKQTINFLDVTFNLNKTPQDGCNQPLSI